MKRAVITGIGLVTPLGVSTEATWNGLIEGRTGIGQITLLDASSLRTQLAGEVANFNPQDFVTNRRTLRIMTRGEQLAFAGATLALRDSHLDINQLDGDRTGLFVGANKDVCDLTNMTDAILDARNPDGTVDIHRFQESAPSKVNPLLFVVGLPGVCLFYLSQAYGIKGSNTFFAGTADASAIAIGSAYRAICRGEVDVAIAGGFDDTVSWWNLTKLEALSLMSDRNDLGPKAYKPFDKNRTGTIVGEGAAFLILEEYQAAKKRGANIYAEVIGFGNGYDAYRLITPHPEGRGLTRAMYSALREADTSPEAIDYVIAHGSGTKLGDSSEAKALHKVFGTAANDLAASSIKPSTGHLVAAAGALNAAVAALAIHHQILPPTLNLEDLDPECEFDWVSHQARKTQLKQVLSLARGLEGQNVALAMRQV